jgi:CelD/BcsL family acetyltransferase involved in cellulose biosynthesis
VTYEHASAFETLRQEWNELLHRSDSDRVFSTWEWQSTWWEAYRPGQLWIVACRDEHDRLIALGPWFIENHPVHGRVVRSIGCVEVTDYLDIILDREYTEPALNCLAAYLRENRSKYDVIDLCNLPEDSPVYQRFPGILNQHGFEVKVTVQEVCPVINLPGDWEAYLSTLDKKQRHEVRRKVRRAESGEEKVDWYIVGEGNNLEEETQRFLTLMAASHPEKAGFLDDPQNVAFFKSIIPVAYHNKWLQLAFLTINNQPAAAYLNFVYRKHVLVYNSGLMTEKYGHLSAGNVLLAYLIQHAIQNGYAVFDFLRGNEIYKYRMGAKDTNVYMLRAELKG